MTLRNSTSALLFTVTTALAACGPTPATTEGVRIGDPVAPEDRPPYRVYDNWDNQTRFNTPYSVFQNVDLDDMPTLLVGHTFVGYFEGPKDDNYGNLAVFHWTGSQYHWCKSSSGDPEMVNGFWRPTMWQDVRRNLQYPSYESSRSGDWENDWGYQSLQYNGDTGAFAFLSIYNGKYWDMNKGHIQRGIPAAVYDLCPNFPSTSSLGVPLIQDQTATNYFELLEQNAGNRIRRPDLVTDYTPRHWYME